MLTAQSKVVLSARIIRWLTLCCLATLPVAVHAQAPPAGSASCTQYPGDRYAYGTSGDNSHAYIDASVFLPGPTSSCSLSCTSSDVCCAISCGLQSLRNQLSCNTSKYVNKGVIDARGILPPSGGTLSCSTNPFPSGGSTVGATVLLPAGTISGVSNQWELPSNTHLIGQGPGAYGATTASGATVIQFSLSGGTSTAPMYMLEIGDTSLCGSNDDCNGISIEHLRIDASNSSGYVVGIFNDVGQELNYANDVAITGLNSSSTGLMILGQSDANPPASGALYYADNSGPYTDIYVSGAGTCLNIDGTYGTRGVNGLTCYGGGSNGNAAVLLDGSNNTIQNVTISGYTGDGILIGSQLSSQNASGAESNNLIFNVSAPSVTNAIHISGTPGNTCGKSGTLNCPSDITLMGINGGTTASIQDDLSSSTVTGSTGLYVLGEPTLGQTTTPGYSRFTTGTCTNHGCPSWFVGPAGSEPTTGASCSTLIGSLFSVTTTITSTPHTTLWGCTGTGTWEALSGSN